MRASASALVLLATLILVSPTTLRADEPQSNEAAVSTQWLPGQAPLPNTGTYYSPSLGANFLIQKMYITQGGLQIVFWGARIVGLDFNSPLRALPVRAGDVITRLDGIKISNNMYMGPDGWIAPELDRHFGDTEVRYIFHGTDYVNVGSININNFLGNGNGNGNVTPVQP